MKQHMQFYEAGYKAGIDGLDTNVCQWNPKSMAGATWFNGYRAGRAARTATCSTEVADFIDPTGALRRAGLLAIA